MTPSKNPDSRHTALAILKAVLLQGRELDAAFAGSKHFALLDARDKGFVKQLVMTCLRHRGALKIIGGLYLKRPLPKKYPELTLLLHMGAAQILYMDVPAYAAVNSTVNLAKMLKLQTFTGLLNAVLKKIDREQDSIHAKTDLHKHTLPRWLKSRWEAQYGAEDTRKIIDRILADPPLDITPKSTADRTRLEPFLMAKPIAPLTLRIHESAGAIPLLPEFDEGTWWVQDLAATLPALLLGDVSGKHVLDACAAPGGKTAQLCAGGATVTALDRSERRLERLGDNMQRLGFEPQVVCADALDYAPEALFDAVLLDAPCSATGTLRRHPDLMWKKSPNDITDLAALQAKLLEQATSWLKTGGTLLYCTCSLEPEEGEQQIAAFLEAHPDWTLSPITPEEAQKIGLREKWVTEKGELRTLPCHLGRQGGMDGFYAARLVQNT